MYTGKKGAFQSDLVYEIFSRHLKQTIGAVVDHELPVGGLALCTAAMERALELWAEGEAPKNLKVSDDDSKNDNKKKVFGGDEWIARTGGYATLASGLHKDDQWPIIITEAEARFPNAVAVSSGLVVAAPLEAQAIRAALSLW
ncbi:hypothetical protein D9615_003638 [Tricholomella constricta]|uniref:Uncharacterized protein n=1 Tax=Tricholomella constricta TaxID=117010 RepID=A0A8H5HII0_9AGAR|nr:hypothetical protein D9615_003638 [Tricholomella constricta]